jgi:hypothetical protein
MEEAIIDTDPIADADALRTTHAESKSDRRRADPGSRGQ